MIRVGVLRGGPSSEHDISLLSGANVLKRLEESEKYRPVEIFIDKQGTWHVRGVPMSPERALAGIDVVFNALHGQYGEDGTVQKVLERHGVPYTGSGPFASALAMNKRLAKEELKKRGAKTPAYTTLKVSADLEREAMEAFKKFSPPVVVKPAAAGSSVGVTLAKTFAEFWEGVKKAFEHSTEVIVEEYIKGKEATAGVVEGLRGEKIYSLLPIEIIPPPKKFFDREVKYNGETLERVPGNFTKEESAELERLAALAHEALGLRHYSRSDFIVSPRGIYFLESNTLPGITAESLLPKSLAAAGISQEDFFDHLLQTAMARN
ncbi:MAG: D-alanine--D-alanine ligase [Patescibacteria group bacterium]|nr:D-alanine--D-alanine ligase [Patescibacteria group bacterium]